MCRKIDKVGKLSTTLRWCGIAIAIAMAMPGCGKKGPPFIPARVPKRVLEEVGVSLHRGGVLISWRATTVHPEPGEKPGHDEFRISRWEKSSSPEQIAAIRSSGEGSRWYEYLDLMVVPQREYRYVIHMVSPEGDTLFRSREMDVITVEEWCQPGGVRVNGGDRRAILSWNPVSFSEEGEKGLIGYNIFRRRNGDAYNLMQPLTPMPVKETFFLDTGLENGGKYCYALTTVLSGETGIEESGLSPESCAIPEDTFPPAPPVGVHLETGADHILVSWDENKENDLAGYRVYRRQGVEAAFLLLTREVVSYLSYRDEDVNAGSEYYYAVTAVDSSAAANESPFSKIARVVLLP